MIDTLIKFWILISLLYFSHSRKFTITNMIRRFQEIDHRIDDQRDFEILEWQLQWWIFIEKNNEGKLRLIRYRTIIWREFVPNSWSCLIYETIKNDRSISAKLEPSIEDAFLCPIFQYFSCPAVGYFTWWNTRISRWIRRW